MPCKLLTFTSHHALKNYEPSVNDCEKAFAIGKVPQSEVFGMQQVSVLVGTGAHVACIFAAA